LRDRTPGDPEEAAFDPEGPMFFIVGIKTRTTSVSEGRFRCPNEGADRPYSQLRARRWFTVFFIPLLPLGTQAEWVRCGGCGARYGPDVLARHPAAGHPSGR
jgi:hypothetical protein